MLVLLKDIHLDTIFREVVPKGTIIRELEEDYFCNIEIIHSSNSSIIGWTISLFMGELEEIRVNSRPANPTEVILYGNKQAHNENNSNSA